MSSLVELGAVSKTYQRGSESIAAVKGVTLSIPAGDFVAVAGPSGSGKTTLLNLIGCLDTPDAGTVWVDGEDTTRLSEAQLTRLRARTVGFVFQQFFLLPTLTVEENVLLPTLFVRNGSGGPDRALELLRYVGLEARRHHRPAELSGGEMQRVAIARALMNRPQVLLADEPTGNLDSGNAARIFDIFRRLNAEGLTIIVVTHSAELAACSRRILRMKDGQIEGVATPAEGD